MLQDRPREFLAATGLTLAEFEKLYPAFQVAYEKKYPPDRTLEGKARQRRAGAGATGNLSTLADKLLFILVYQKTTPLQTMHGLQCNLSQAHTNYWIHVLLPVLQHALAALEMQPERDASRVAVHPLPLEGAPQLAIDGTARRRQRPTAPGLQREHSSGTKKTHTDKNILLVNDTTGKVVYRSPTEPGKTHEKKVADQVQIAYPRNATLDKDTGCQGYDPGGVRTQQPQKNFKARHCALGSGSSITSSPVRASWWRTCLPGSNGVGWSQMSCGSRQRAHRI